MCNKSEWAEKEVLKLILLLNSSQNCKYFEIKIVTIMTQYIILVTCSYKIEDYFDVSFDSIVFCKTRAAHVKLWSS